MSSNQITVFITGCPNLGPYYDATPEVVKRFTEIFLHTVAQLEPKRTVTIVQASLQTKAEYAFVVFDRSLSGNGHFFTPEIDPLQEEALRYAEKVYGIHITTRWLTEQLMQEAALDNEYSLIRYEKNGSTQLFEGRSRAKGAFCFYFPKAGQLVPREAPIRCSVTLPEPMAFKSHDPFINAVAEKLASSGFAKQLDVIMIANGFGRCILS